MPPRTLDRMLHRRASGALAVVLCFTCILPASAMALEPGVHVDPNSPAAKEYGVPLWVLRGQGSGQQSPEGIPPPPLFGVGIGPAASVNGTGAGNGGGSRAGGHARGGSTSGQRGSGSHSPGRAGASAAGSTETLTPAAIAQLTHEGSAAPHVGLAVGGVLVGGLLLGGAVALAMRRLRR
jgi:hypothetical protein